MSIRKVSSIINSGRGVAAPNRYQVLVNFPSGLAGASILRREIAFLAEIAELPGRQIATTPQMIYGVQRKMPYGVIYDDLNITFICTNDMLVRSVFDQWHSIITDPTNNYFNYYDTYVGNLEIQKLDEQNNTTYTILVEEVYPITITAQELNSNSQNEYLRLNISFAYRRWRTPLDSPNGAFSGPDVVFGDTSGALTLPPALPNISRPTSPPANKSIGEVDE